MIEYLILDNEQQVFDIISDVKQAYHKILLDFPIKFKDENTGQDFYIFVVMEEYREYLLPTYQNDLVESIPTELIPLEQ